MKGFQKARARRANRRSKGDGPDPQGRQRHTCKQKTPHRWMKGFQKKGDDILSHITAVPSAQAGLTSLFGMGRGEPRRNNHLKSLHDRVDHIILLTYRDKEKQIIKFKKVSSPRLASGGKAYISLRVISTTRL
jgi:hypothetical protein